MTQIPGGVPKHYLNPCMIFVHRNEYLVSTVLGSCVSVCLWDSRMECGGINHYMLPLWNGEGLPTPKYGNIAIEKLLRRMQDMGCSRDRLVAKVFGGGNVLNSGPGLITVGDRNVAIAEELLSQHRIRIVGSSTGGSIGLKLFFNTKTGVVFVAHLKPGNTLQSLPDGRPGPH